MHAGSIVCVRKPQSNRGNAFALQGETCPIVGDGLVTVLLRQLDLRPSQSRSSVLLPVLARD